jgi:alkanesulfonate monooxygenase SsuD/methylene tetrahydromethanopterin reductase-like flavin-dependent oxidoreductase (luciferase family)
VKLGVAFTWHVHPWEELLALVRRAEELGFAAAFVDGDISQLASKSQRDVLDGWTVTTALLAHTQRIQVGSIRLVHQWNAARLAQAVATQERLQPGRLRFVIGLGDRPHDERFGFPKLSRGERMQWLDETLTALRGLWRGEAVTLAGRWVRLDEARVRPVPQGGRVPIAIAAGGPRMLELVAAHADVWEVNLPPLASRVQAAAATLARACEARRRDPAEIGRSQWIFTRLGDDQAAARREYRARNPWFGAIPDTEIARALVVGNAAHCRGRLAELAGELALDLPVVDLSGLAAEPARRLLEALAP